MGGDRTLGSYNMGGLTSNQVSGMVAAPQLQPLLRPAFNISDLGRLTRLSSQRDRLLAMQEKSSSSWSNKARIVTWFEKTSPMYDGSDSNSYELEVPIEVVRPWIKDELDKVEQLIEALNVSLS